jgi:hypothetical protein
MKLPILPVYYYHDHFTEMLGFVSETYGPVYRIIGVYSDLQASKTRSVCSSA